MLPAKRPRGGSLLLLLLLKRNISSKSTKSRALRLRFHDAEVVRAKKSSRKLSGFLGPFFVHDFLHFCFAILSTFFGRFRQLFLDDLVNFFGTVSSIFGTQFGRFDWTVFRNSGPCLSLFRHPFGLKFHQTTQLAVLRSISTSTTPQDA